MHFLLLHKPDAGTGEHTRADLVALFEACGHEVTYSSLDNDDWPALLDTPAEAVAVAGGDGTMAQVAERLLGRGLPLAILPVGTANNIALKLGLSRPLKDIVAGLEDAERRPFDVGNARGPWGVRRFVEGVGIGVFARVIAFAKAESGGLVPEPEKRGAELNRDLRLLRAFLHDHPPDPCTLRLDGNKKTGEYLLFEAMNTGYIGPHVPLAPDADPGDGMLDVVVAGEAERKPLEGYLTARLEGGDVAPFLLSVTQASSVRLSVHGVRVHIDGEVWPDEEDPPPAHSTAFEVEIDLEPGALTVLVPK